MPKSAYEWESVIERGESSYLPGSNGCDTVCRSAASLRHRRCVDRGPPRNASTPSNPSRLGVAVTGAGTGTTGRKRESVIKSLEVQYSVYEEVYLYQSNCDAKDDGRQRGSLRGWSAEGVATLSHPPVPDTSLNISRLISTAERSVAHTLISANRPWNEWPRREDPRVARGS